MASVIGASGELGQQARLPYARLADEEDRGRLALIELVENSIERARLLDSPDELVEMQGRHVSLLTSIKQGRSTTKIRVRIRVSP